MAYPQLLVIRWKIGEHLFETIHTIVIVIITIAPFYEEKQKNVGRAPLFSRSLEIVLYSLLHKIQYNRHSATRP